MSKKIFKLSLLILIVSLLVSACTFPWKKKVTSDTNQTNSGEVVADDIAPSISTKQIKKFTNYQELKDFLEENSNNQNLSTNVLTSSALRGVMENFSMDVSGSPALTDSSANNSASSQGASDYSTTNNQVVGVDEADIIKTDGTYIYALVRNELKIIKASPAGEANVVSTITFKSRPQDIFISGTSLSVFGADQQIYTMEIYKNFRRQNPYTFFKVFDLSSPTEPKLVRDLNFEGSYTNARLIGDYAYLFTNSSAGYIENEPLVPRVINNGDVLASSCELSNKCFVPEVYYFDIPYDSYNFVNITAINVKDNNEDISGQSYLMNYGQNFYVSKNNIYITYSEYVNEYELEQLVRKELALPKLSVEDQDKISKIELAPSFILNKNEKQIKSASIIDRYFSSLSIEDKKALQISIDDNLKQKLTEQASNLEKTVIHKIAINGKALEYRGMGEVKGQVLNQFSMDENGDYFRIATTRNQIWSRLSDKPEDSYSNIFVLNNELKLVGSLENLATTERIYSARFMGDRVYLVTFKQTDPLYVISLSDPAQPVVLGAVKVPGFSTYLHPADKNGNQLIGLGRDTEEDASGIPKLKGIKLSLFDFTDLSKPKELSSYIIGDASSDSIAFQDHKAFLYSEEKKILSIPATFRDGEKISFSGALVFNIVNNSFALKGQIDHSEGGKFSEPDYFDSYGSYENTVKRSLYINENLYTFSNKFLKINSLSDLASVKNIVLSGSDDFIVTPNQGQGIMPISGSNQNQVPNSIQDPGAIPAASPSSGLGTPEAVINPDNLVPPVDEGLLGDISTTSLSN